MLSRTVTDTTVTPNVSRTWTYTYNANGRVLTEDGPRTDVNDITTYTYYACTTGAECGQVSTVTNALLTDDDVQLVQRAWAAVVDHRCQWCCHHFGI